MVLKENLVKSTARAVKFSQTHSMFWKGSADLKEKVLG